ncbi:hypothetical protein [Mycobacterium asiaticum]|uniref:Uncharacterized protein n=1 Tax=Mycobacterium asiaticum TaxID=1790 RepID=A0A1A3CW27_MYCAS|nr:hypothetical protein [Mycobacterium asiaticum]OBI90266.1 hypothetical protein A9X01_12275 [Mycobacterium asiaticum]
MRLRFGTSDYHAFIDTRGVLLDELDEWLAPKQPERVEVLADVKSFLDWRYRESIGALDEFTLSDISRFLLEWCPRRLKGQPDAAINLCSAVGVYFDFMADTGRLVGGAGRAARLRSLTDDLVRTVVAEVRDPTPAVGESYQLPFLHVPPSASDVAAAAEAAPLLTKIDALRSYVGSAGKPLTDKGHFQLADGRALVEKLQTGDVLAVELGGRTIRPQSTASMRRLNFIFSSAVELGAVKLRQHRVVPGPTWDSLTPVERARGLFAAIRELRPLRSLLGGWGGESDELAKLLEDGIVHWLVALLIRDGGEVPFDILLNFVQSVVLKELGPDEEDMLEDNTEEGLALYLEVLAEAGVLRWTNRSEVRPLLGPSRWTGGTLALTALGRHILPDHLSAAGYSLRCLDQVAEWDATALIDAMVLSDKKIHAELVANWQAHRPAIERVRMLTEAIVAAPDAAHRLAGLGALDEFAIEVTEPFVRQLLDSPVSGHAALWLISRQRADTETLGRFVDQDIAVLVDALALKVDEPAALCSFFTGPEPMRQIEDIWRHPAPETTVVLEALGRHLPDPALRKAARRALVRHRSWMANRQN